MIGLRKECIYEYNFIFTGNEYVSTNKKIKSPSIKGIDLKKSYSVEGLGDLEIQIRHINTTFEIKGTLPSTDETFFISRFYLREKDAFIKIYEFSFSKNNVDYTIFLNVNVGFDEELHNNNIKNYYIHQFDIMCKKVRYEGDMERLIGAYIDHLDFTKIINPLMVGFTIYFIFLNDKSDIDCELLKIKYIRKMESLGIDIGAIYPSLFNKEEIRYINALTDIKEDRVLDLYTMFFVLTGLIGEDSNGFLNKKLSGLIENISKKEFQKAIKKSIKSSKDIERL